MEQPTQIHFNGTSGIIDCAIDWPDDNVIGWALVLHPHPLHGGTRNNKVVTTIAKACTQHGLVAVRPNFRGVGDSAGEFDHGKAETEDMLALIEQFTQQFPQVAQGQWVLAGFSFGTAVAAQVYSALLDAEQPLPGRVLLAGPAVHRFGTRSIQLPEATFLVHGEDDEVVALTEVMEFAREHDLPVTVIPGSTHFFHGKLLRLRDQIAQQLR